MSGVFGENLPYTNFHDLNLDWLIETMKETKGSVDDFEEELENINTRIDNIIVEAQHYILPSTNDNTDRKDDIMNFLNTYGYCFLGPGTFVINSTINMPDRTSIMGMGSGTILQLADDSTQDIAINVGSYCSVSNMRIIGNSTDLPYTAYAQGNRKGIALLGDFVTFNEGTYSHNFSKLDNLTIENFNHSGIWAYRNDGAASFLASNIDILRCHTGINIENFSEFHSYNNIRCRWCNIACVMQGGNNLFTNCHFDVNIAGIKIDNTDDDVVNGDHSSFSNCSICHSDNNTGYAIWAKRSLYGLLFSNCQIWYGEIYLDTCSAIKFDNNTFADVPTTITNSNNITFTNNLFRSSDPQITITNCIGIIWENNQNANAQLIIRTEDRGNNRNLNASAIRIANYSDFEMEAFGKCMQTNLWTVVLPLPGYFEFANVQYNINRVVFIGIGQVPDSDLANINTNLTPMFIRVTNIPYTGTPGDTAIISVKASLVMQ